MLLNGDATVPFPITVDPVGFVEVKPFGAETITLSEYPVPSSKSTCLPLSMSMMVNCKLETGDEKMNVIS